MKEQACGIAYAQEMAHNGFLFDEISFLYVNCQDQK